MTAPAARASTDHPSPAPASPVRFEVAGGVGTITLDRPRAINALTHEMVGLIDRALRDWAVDDAVRTVVLTGAGDRGLCAGGDIRAVHADAVAGGSASVDFWRDEYRLNAFIGTYPKPFVAIMDGITMGGGVGLAGHAAHRVVTERSVVGMPEVGIGLCPDVGGTLLLARAPGHLGTHLGLTAGRMDAADAVLAGFADLVVPSGHLPELLDRLTRQDVPTALAAVAQPPGPGALAADRDWIDRCYAAGTVPEIVAALRAAPEAGARRAAEAITTASPTAVTVTLAALTSVRTIGASLEQALNQEFSLSCAALRHPDLAEGIRAQIIDKDRMPRWSPPTFDQVDPVVVAGWFTPRPDAPFPDQPFPTSEGTQS
ncbi:enoyl-CoA hydratase/isomerase family protein [Nakamurella leprariae]|uniref:3-hydroxyisobutyryl-CoA hydrolase n=1 Tax=Nakamurella leprariae TaxID=2803911 RepID=A0A938YEC3_9ACTN|nr:enoyl-CoA hydratase/isomerase family protein [Nakamurella leprariae]MBM9468013.1 enoyl-CoA hydratase/isomerase family protein [Nakamurella leprariae]